MNGRHLILVIDDEPTTLKVVEGVLKKAGYRVETTTEPEEGLHLADKLDPSVVIVDIMMPRLNGFEVTKHILSMGRPVQVVLRTGSAEPPNIHEALRIGVSDYLTKPCNPEELIDAVARATQRYERWNKVFAQAIHLKSRVARKIELANSTP